MSFPAVHKLNGDMAGHQGVVVVIVRFFRYQFPEEFGLLIMIQGELIRAVIFPPAGIVILAQIQGDAEDIGKGEPVIEALVFAGFDVD